jgi:hypothetical protein
MNENLLSNKLRGTWWDLASLVGLGGTWWDLCGTWRPLWDLATLVGLGGTYVSKVGLYGTWWDLVGRDGYCSVDLTLLNILLHSWSGGKKWASPHVATD